jgi:alpha-N-arabinofuranosidase
MNVFLRKSDVLKMAALAQIVNVIAPILTTTDSMLKQSIYYPIMLFNNLASGNALDVNVRSPMYNTKKFGDMPLLDVSSSHNPETNTNAIFIVNRSQTESITVDINWQDVAPKAVNSAHQVSGTDPKAANSFANPDVVKAVKIAAPDIRDGNTTIELPPLSFTAIEVAL